MHSRIFIIGLFVSPTFSTYFNCANNGKISVQTRNFFFQGFELEDQDSDQERQLQLQRVAEEWDNILGRSHEDNCDPSEGTIEWVTEANVESSNDSMRTMFSNSAVNLPMASGGRLCEVSNNNKSAAGAIANDATAADCTENDKAAPVASGRPSSALRRQ